jgi:carotenoid cleavage dioxygenase-like enzyme
MPCLLGPLFVPGLAFQTATSLTENIVDISRLRAADAMLRSRHGKAENGIMNELFRPANSEVASARAHLIAGALPHDLPRGAVLKNGPNPQPQYATEQGGWLDGDGMIHCVVLRPDAEGDCMYSRTWVRTDGFSKEAAAGKRLFDGSLVAPRGLPLLWGLLMNGLRALQPQKDTANTGLLPLGSGGRCLALMEQCLPSELQVRSDASVTTVGAGLSFDGQLVDLARHPFAGGALTAHLKTDPATNEKVGVTYPSSGNPGARVTTIGADGALASDVMVPLQSSVQSMIHDCAITPQYALLLDLPMTVRPARMLSDKFPVEYEPEAGGRIGVYRRHASGASSTSAAASSTPAAAADAAAARTRGTPGAAVWFEVEPCVVLHTVNAHESADGATVTLTALRSQPTGEASFIEAYSSAYLHQWVLDMSTGKCVSEGTISETPLEFPALDGRLTGQDAKYGYAITPRTIGGPNRYGPPFEGILIDGVVKLDLRTGATAAKWTAPTGFYLVSEPTFVPRVGSEAGEGDEGYLIVFVCAAKAGTAAGNDSPAAEVSEPTDGRASRLYVIDAKTMATSEEDPSEDVLAGGAVAALSLPAAVPYGLHSCWLPYEELPAPA